MKILTILGARPQFIKAGTVSREISKNKNIQEIIIHTGQHYDNNMSDIFFKEMKIPKPNYYLGIGGKSHGAMTGQMIEKIEEVVIKEEPDWIVVYGDTNSTLAGAIVASKLHIKLAHIEAGLRSFNMKMPEEVNRILTDRVSNVLFCPTISAVENLKNEGYDKLSCKIINSGDVMQDGANFYKNYAKKPSFPIESEFMLCTVHRAENTDDIERLKNIFSALNELAEHKQIILPLHPRTKKIIEKFQIQTKNLLVVDPIGYLEMIWLLDNCVLVLTDSGGLQKEAFFFAKNCLILRDETEWVELVENGSNILVGSDKLKIIEGYQYFSKKDNQFSKENSSNFNKGIYGNGNASKIILNELLK